MSNFHGSGTADITVCSVQSLLRSDRLAKFNPDWCKLILIDEAHHAAAPTYLRILEHFGALSKESKAVVVGVSATLSRLDGLKLGAALDEIVYHRDYIEMIGEKWLDIVRITLTAGYRLLSLRLCRLILISVKYGTTNLEISQLATYLGIHVMAPLT
jgi:ATP-dependent helicase IRC3